MSGFAALLRRDAALAWSGGGGAAAPLAFFVGASTLVPLAVGAERELLARIGPSLLLVFAALAALLTFERLFQADLEDGTLDQLALSETPLEAQAAAKGLAVLAAIGAPLTLLAGPVAIGLQTPPAAAPIVMLAVALALVAFYGVGMLGAALAAGVRRGGLLIAVVTLPFFAPPVIFAAGAAAAAARGEPVTGPLALLAGCALAAAALGPIGAAAALRAHLD